MAGFFHKIKDFIYKTNILVSRSKEYYDKQDLELKMTQEMLWRDVFVDTVAGYEWYKKKSISLGR